MSVSRSLHLFAVSPALSALAVSVLVLGGCSSRAKSGPAVPPADGAPTQTAETGMSSDTSAPDASPSPPDGARPADTSTGVADAPAREVAPDVARADRRVGRDGRDGSTTCGEVPVCQENQYVGQIPVGCPGGYNVCVRSVCCRSEYQGGVDFMAVTRCLECTCDSQCPANRPFCQGGMCMGCASDGDCPADRPCCDRQGGIHQECAVCGP
jgi:hypothetical protein